MSVLHRGNLMAVKSAAPIEIDDDALFSSPDTCRMARVSFRQIDYWARTGVIEPDTPATGSGSHRRFTGAQVRDIAMIGRLRELGVGLEAIGEVLAVTDEWERALIVIAPEFVRAVDPGDIADAVTEAHGAAVVVDVETLRTLDAEPAKPCPPARKRPLGQGARPRNAVRAW